MVLLVSKWTLCNSSRLAEDLEHHKNDTASLMADLQSSLDSVVDNPSTEEVSKVASSFYQIAETSRCQIEKWIEDTRKENQYIRWLFRILCHLTPY